MDHSAWVAVRTFGLVVAGFVVAAGLAFAYGRGGSPSAPAQPVIEQASPTAARATPQLPNATGTLLPATATSPPAPTAPPASAPETVVPAAAVQRPTTAALPTATEPPGPVSDLPKYTDVAVLALAADAVLPSGKTFRQCVELPPSHEKWPTPVHLYYQGKGRWLVETHISEVQVVFDEATATFRAGNFAPTNSACR